MNNRYEICGNTAIIYLQTKNGIQLKTIIDAEDLPKAQLIEGRWYAVDTGENKPMYVIHKRKNKINEFSKKKTLCLHRYLTNCTDDLTVDHINHDAMDNRKSNLRLCTNAENQQNRNGAYRSNKSCGIRGVTWDKNKNKWVAYVNLNKKYNFLGYFDSPDEAGIAALEGRKIFLSHSIN